MITAIQHDALRAEIGNITEGDHLELKIRVLTMQMEALASGSRMRNCQSFTTDDTDELINDMAVHLDLLGFAVMRLRGLP